MEDDWKQYPQIKQALVLKGKDQEYSENNNGGGKFWLTKEEFFQNYTRIFVMCL